MKTKSWLIPALLLTTLTVFGQVDDIKGASKNNSSNKSSGSSDRGSSGGGSNLFFFFDMFRVLGAWQGSVLDKRSDVPQIVSLDLMLHSAIQPSSYYTFNPRVRGNWGILSTDFRWNVLVEQTIEGNESLNTFDWQIVQLNFVNTKNVIVRAGAGYMQENFAAHNSFFESTISSNLMFDDNKWGGFIEWRAAKDFETTAVPRREFNLQVQKQIFEAGPWHGMVTAGLQFQRWYSSVNVWGMQGGFVLKLY
jgi:hypothetical protein